MEYLTIIKAFETIINAAPTDIQFSTYADSVLDGDREEAVVFTLVPMTGEILVDERSFDVFNIEFVLSELMDEEEDDTERNESLSSLKANTVLIFEEFKKRHIDDATTINGESLNCVLTTDPVWQTMWNQGHDNFNAVQCTFSVRSETPNECSTTLFTY
jgi:hypothetical protein